jgi:hypothetical protein
MKSYLQTFECASAEKRRLKAGGSQDWLPHEQSRQGRTAWFQLCCSVGQPVVAAAGFQPAPSRFFMRFRAMACPPEGTK